MTNSRVGFESVAPLGVEQIDHVRWRTTHRLVFRYRDTTGTILTVEVEPGYVTDFATEPSPLRGLLPKSGRHNPATIIHDRLCEQALAGRISRREADRVFRLALEDLDVDERRPRRGADDRIGFTVRWMMWSAVRWGGLVTHPRQALDFARDLPKVAPLTILALPIVVPTAGVTGLALLVIAAVKATERLITNRQGGDPR